MNFRHAIICAICLSTIAAGGVSGGSITGVVTDSESGDPIPYATVQMEGSGLGGYADSIGHFTIQNVPSGEHTILVTSVRHKILRSRIAIDERGDTSFDPVLEPSPVQAGSIVVTGTRTPRYIKEVPVFTEVVSRKAIEDKSAGNIFEALDGVSGVKVEQQCQGCNFSILRMQGLGADHTQILLDGQPVYSGLAAVYGLQQMSTADVSQIEIVKGAGSALYGSNAVAGAINIVSTVPRKTEMEVGIELGEHGTNKYDVVASTRKDNLGVFLFAQQTDQDELDETGDVNAAGGVDNPDGWIDRVRSSTRNIGFNLFLDDVLSSDRLVLRGRLLHETRAGGWLTDDQFLNPFAPGTEAITTDRLTGQLEYTRWLASGAELSVSLAFNRHDRDATNDTFLSDYAEAYGRMPSVDLLRPYVANERLVVANANVVLPIGVRHRVLIGTQYTYNNLEESGMYLDLDTEQPYSSTADKTANQFGAYLQDEIKLSSKLELVAGLRFDYHKSEDEFRGSGDVLASGLEPLEYDEAALNPRFAIKYNVGEGLTLRGSAGGGYRVPYGFSEGLHLCSGSPRVYKGGALEPEKSFSYSLTADYTHSDYSASLNVYRTELSDAIAFAEATPDIEEMGYTYQWENIDDAYVMGAELNGSLALADQLVLAARFELFEGRYDDARPDWVGTPYEADSRNVSRYPVTSGGLKIEFSPADWGFVVEADYNGKMYIDLAEPADPSATKIHQTEPYVTVNSKISRRLYDRFNVYIGVDNLSDYTQEEKHIDDAAFMYAPVYGRLIYGGMRVSM